MYTRVHILYVKDGRGLPEGVRGNSPLPIYMALPFLQQFLSCSTWQTTIKLETAVNFQHSQSVAIGLWEEDPILFKDFITSLSYLRVKTIIKQLNKTEMNRIQSLRSLRKILEIFLLCVKHTDIRFPYKSELCSFFFLPVSSYTLLL